MKFMYINVVIDPLCNCTIYYRTSVIIEVRSFRYADTVLAGLVNSDYKKLITVQKLDCINICNKLSIILFKRLFNFSQKYVILF